MKLISTTLCFTLLSGCFGTFSEANYENYSSKYPTEQFIRSHLLNDHGLLQTDILNRNQEYLSESIGLYLLFLVNEKRKEEFEAQINILREVFLHPSAMISWEVTGSPGSLSKSPVNAWIDDTRIYRALLQASVTFVNPTYAELAEEIRSSLQTSSFKQDLPMDYVDMNTKQTGSVVTLSYLDYDFLADVSSKKVQSAKSLLKRAPIDGPFFAKSYDVKTKRYTQDETVNLIDQVYVAFRYEQFGLDTTTFASFLEKELRSGQVFGRYDRKTKLPAVDYESQAVYALMIFYWLERNQTFLAEQTLRRLKAFEIQDENSEYYGGYIDLPSKQTHTFDNLLPLLAERRLVHGSFAP